MHNDSLKSLALVDNDIGDEGVLGLAGALLRNFSVNTISIGDEAIQGGGLLAIAKLIEGSSCILHFHIESKAISPSDLLLFPCFLLCCLLIFLFLSSSSSFIELAPAFPDEEAAQNMLTALDKNVLINSLTFWGDDYFYFHFILFWLLLLLFLDFLTFSNSAFLQSNALSNQCS